MLGLVVAMNEEMELLLKNIHQNTFEKKEDVFTTYKFNINNKKIIGIVSGVGKIKASAATEYLISNFEITRLFNFGMAGGIDKSVNIGDVINIVKSYDNDEDLSAFGHKKVVRELVKLDEFKYKSGICVSGDKFVNNIEEANDINNRYNALCYEMELSAISMIANLHKLPITSLKYISDKADENADFDFNESLKKAMENFSEFLMNIIKKV